MTRFALILLPLLGACAGSASGLASAPDSEPIVYERTACFGFCPSFRVAVDANGAGTYRGIAHVAVQGERRFTASPAELAAFRAALAPVRPEGAVTYGHGRCDAPMRTDQPGVRIAWGTDDRLAWNFGCRQPGLVDRQDAVADAWQILPIAGLVGTDDDRGRYPR